MSIAWLAITTISYESSVARSLTISGTTILVLSFITSRLEYCFILYSDLSSGWLACLDRVLRFVARIIGRIPNLGNVSSFMLDVLNWLLSATVLYTWFLCLVWRCQLGCAPVYLWNLCRPVLGSQGGGCSLCCLPARLPCRTMLLQWWAQRRGLGSHLELRLLPRTISDTFYTSLKTALFAGVGALMSRDP